MTPASLTRTIVFGTAQELADALAPLSEAERKKLSRVAIGLYQASWDQDLVLEEEVARHLDEPLGDRDPHDKRARMNMMLAILGLGSLGQIKKSLSWHGFSDPPNVYQELQKIVLDRRPKWANAWTKGQAKDPLTDFIDWPMLKTFVGKGLVPKPDSPTAAIMLLSYAKEEAESAAEGSSRIREVLLSEPEILRDDLWSLLQLEWLDRYNCAPYGEDPMSGDDRWPSILRSLADEGHIDRDRLLDENLAALGIVQKQPALAILCKFHRFTAPTIAERKQREDVYLGLLNHKASFVVALGFDMLEALADGGALDGSRYCQGAAPLLPHLNKGSARKALKIAGIMVKRGESFDDGIFLLALRSMDHEAAAIQEQGLALLEARQNQLPPEVHGDLKAKRSGIAASLRGRLDAVLQDHDGAPVEPSDEPALARDATETLAALSARAAALPPDHRGWLGLTDLEQVLARRRGLPPLAYDVMEAPTLPNLERITPIETVEDLIDAVAQAAEHLDGAEQFERILGAISRLCDQRPANFEQRTEALLRRLKEPTSEKGLFSTGPCGIAAKSLVGIWLRETYESLANRWFDGLPPIGPARNWPDDRWAFPYDLLVAPFAFTIMRLTELKYRVHARCGSILLAEPTHVGGWIDPGVFVERALVCQGGKAPILKSDFIQGLLRLAPDGRDGALEASAEITGLPGKALRWALGGSEPPRRPAAGDLAVWIAAGRARDPLSDLSVSLAKLRLPAGIPDLLTGASYGWKANVDIQDRRITGRVDPAVFISPCPGPQDSSFRACLPPSVAFHRPSQHKKLLSDTEAAFLTELGVGLKRIDKLQDKGTAGARGVLEDFKPKGKDRRSSLEKAIGYLPTVAMHIFSAHDLRADSTDRSPDFSTPWSIALLGLTWPQNPDSALVLGASAIGCRLDKGAVHHAPDYAFLEPLFDHARPWSEMAGLVACLSMSAKDSDCRTTAVDALIDALEDGRADPMSLANSLQGLAQHDFLKVNRIGEALTLVAETSPLHRLAVASLLQRLFARIETLPKNAHLLLQLLQDSLSDLGLTAVPETHARLAAAKGSSKGAKIARQICKLEPSPNQLLLDAALVQALKARLARAESWSASLT